MMRFGGDRCNKLLRNRVNFAACGATDLSKMRLRIHFNQLESLAGAPMAKKEAQDQRPVPEVGTEPLPGGGSNFRSKKFTRDGDRFVIKPTLGQRLFGFAFLLFGGVPLGIAIYQFIVSGARTESWVIGGFGVVFLAVGLAILISACRVEFDWINDVFRRRWLLVRRERSISDIAAVRLIHGGWHNVRNSNGSHSSYYTYQVNLVLHDEKVPRLNVLNQSDWDSCWQCADQLADFLEVPFLDHVSESEGE
jgi:hypothetical protein